MHKFQNVVQKLLKCFTRNDATLIEINPLVLNTHTQDFMCLDTKMAIDDNAFYRQKATFNKMENMPQSKQEKEAQKYDLNYINLDGNIGCLVNGAGLAMATMDLINLKGGKPANFLDIGGGARSEQVQAALKLIYSDTKTKAIYINIFGGIVRCDVIADGIIRASRSFTRNVPIIARLKGTHKLSYIHSKGTI